MAESDDWRPEDFSQRVYSLLGAALEDTAKHNVRLVLEIDGQRVADFQAREPGLLAFVSRPDDDGVAFVLIEPTGGALTDYPNMLGEYRTPPAPDWALEALGLARNDGHRSPDNAV